jgi:hypothetical protein
VPATSSSSSPPAFQNLCANRKGMPNPIRLAVIAKAHFDVVRLPFPPAWLQRAGLAMGAPLGRLVGYGPTYEPTPGELELATS